MNYSYVLIKDFQNGCRVATTIYAVTLDQQEAYDWIHAETEEFIKRRIEQVIFLS